MERDAPIAARQECVVKAGMKRARLKSNAALVATAQMAQKGVSGVLEPQLMEARLEPPLVIEVEAGVEVTKARQKIGLPLHVERLGSPTESLSFGRRERIRP